MVSSVRNPNESYAQRAKKANTPSASRTPQQRHQQPPDKAPSLPPSSLKPPPINVWAERIKEQKAHAPPQPPQAAPQRAASSPQPARDDAIQVRSSPPDLSAQLAILDQQDEHDPFVVRVPPHLSRQSSSSTNPLPATDPTAWPQLPGADRQSNTSSAGHDSPFLSAAPSRQSTCLPLFALSPLPLLSAAMIIDSTASFRHHAYSSSGSVRLSRVQSSLSQHSHSASQSSAHSRSGSSASSPRLQIRGRTLPHDDALPSDLRLDHQHGRSSNQRSSPTLPDPPNHISSSLDPPLPADPSYYPRPLVPPLQDMPPRYFIPQYALTQQFSPTHVPGHSSPPYLHPSSGQGTPPYPHYPPFPAYMYGHHPFLWSDVPPPHSHHHFQNQPLISSNYINASEHAVPHTTEFGSTSPAITIEPAASKDTAQPPNGWQPRPSKNVVFGTINVAEPEAESAATPSAEQPTDTAVERATEQFAAFSIGVDPNEPGPSRLGSRKSSARSLSKLLSSQPTSNDSVQEAGAMPAAPRETNGIKMPIRWEFGTTHSEDLDDSRPPSEPSPTSLPSRDQPGKSSSNKVEDPPDLVNVSSSHITSQADRSMDKSETDSSASDVWVVKDYGYGFGDHSTNVPDGTRLEMREREKERTRTTIRDQHRDRDWLPARQPGRRHENGNEEGRDSWEQEGHIDAPRHMRSRRGSVHGYGGHDRGGFPGRRGRGFGGRFYGGRGRGGFFHHQRAGSYPFVPPQVPPPPSPFEVLPPAIDVNGYGQPTYAPPELEPYEAIPPTPQAQVPFTSATFSVEAMQNYLLRQLEYWLSPQNMAQDLFLRKRVSRGLSQLLN